MNKKYKRTGHLFQDRFKDYPCLEEGAPRMEARRNYAAFMAEAQEPCHRDGSGRFPLDALAGHVERAGGHEKGFLKGHAKNRVAAKLRARFILDALAAGYRPREKAAFLGMAESVVNWARLRAQ